MPACNNKKESEQLEGKNKNPQTKMKDSVSHTKQYVDLHENDGTHNKA